MACGLLTVSALRAAVNSHCARSLERIMRPFLPGMVEVATPSRLSYAARLAAPMLL